METLRIPTILGLFVLILGVTGGVYLTLGNQTIISRATPQEIPKNISVTNIEDASVSISWQTDAKTSGFVTFGNSGTEETALDDRDQNLPTTRTTHHVTLNGLSPETPYYFKVNSGKLSSQPQQFTTAKVTKPNGLKPIIGSILDGSKPLSAGLVYLSIDGALTQSAVVVDLGNFIIPISKIRRSDLSSIITPSIGTSGKLAVYSEDGRHGSATFTINDLRESIGPLKLDADLDLTKVLGVSGERVNIPGDVNGDGVVNSLDLVLKKIIHH